MKEGRVRAGFINDQREDVLVMNGFAGGKSNETKGGTNFLTKKGTPIKENVCVSKREHGQGVGGREEKGVSFAKCLSR